jgi:iron complex transport system substrate-binding protein
MPWSRVIAALAFSSSVAFAQLPSTEPSSATTRPQRILSLNLCTDQLLLQLVDPGRIAGVSALASDPQLSALSESARGLPLSGNTVEEMLLHKPDLALVGQFWTGEAVEALRRMGVPVLEVPPAETFDEVRRQLLQVAEAVGEPERGRALAADLDTQLEALRARRPPAPMRAALLQPDGSTSGRGTLGDEILASAGFENLAAALGLTGVATLDLERLLLARPELLVSPSYRAEAPTLGRGRVRHPALVRSGIAQLSLPFSLLVCGSTESVRAVRQLVEWREQQGRAP